jgi:hypothetical protein
MARTSYIRWDNIDVHFVLDFDSASTTVSVYACLYSDALSWLRASQSLLFLDAIGLVEKQQIPILLLSIWRDRVSIAVPIKVAVYE